MKNYVVYMLQCSDGSYYIGVTNNLDRRLSEHDAGINQDSYTFERRPLELVYCAEFRNIDDAIAWEKQIKGWSRKKKEALILQDEKSLQHLSRGMYRRRIDIHRLFIQEMINSVMVSSTNHDTNEHVTLRRAQGDTPGSPRHI